MSENIFRIKNISKSFGNHKILKNISLEIKSGEILGIAGASGAGKTTFLNTLIGFLKPEEGDILFKYDHVLSFKKAHTYKSVFKNQQEVKKIYGFTSQVPSFYEELTPKENLEYFGELHNLNSKIIKANSKTLLQLMELENAANIKSKFLSGGMERRLDIACALMHDPKILILDEPTADLDPLLRNHIWEIIRKINRKGTSIILSSHHLNELETLCDRVIFIKNGEIIAKGTPEELKKKFVQKEEIIIQTKPGNYSRIISELNKKKLTENKVVKDSLVISSLNPESDLIKIVGVLKKKREKLTSIKVAGSSLDDVFISLWNDKK